MIPRVEPTGTPLEIAANGGRRPSHEKRFTLDALRHAGILAVVLLIAVCVDVVTRHLVNVGWLIPTSFAHLCIAAITITIEGCHSLLLIAIVLHQTWHGLMDLIRDRPTPVPPPSGGDNGARRRNGEVTTEDSKPAATRRVGEWLARSWHRLRRCLCVSLKRGCPDPGNEQPQSQGYAAEPHTAERPSKVIHVDWPRRASQPVSQRPRARRSLEAASLAAMMVLLVTAGLLLREMTLAEPAAVLITAASEYRTKTLADGSVVSLASNSKLRLDMSGSGRRAQLLAGRAWFNAAPNANRPFIVTTYAGEVATVGASFSVAVATSVTVEVYEGLVKVSVPGRAAVLVRKGERHQVIETRSQPHAVQAMANVLRAQGHGRGLRSVETSLHSKSRTALCERCEAVFLAGFGPSRAQITDPTIAITTLRAHRWPTVAQRMDDATKRTNHDADQARRNSERITVQRTAHKFSGWLFSAVMAVSCGGGFIIR